MKLLDNKVALITGATRGIGKQIAVTYAKNGAHVAFTYASSKQNAIDLEKELSEYGVKAKGYQSDASVYTQCEALVNDVISDFETIDILINNAGITKDNLLLRMAEADFDKIIEVNLKSVFNMTKIVQPIMLKKRAGSIINMSSVVGIKGNAGQSNYAASKAGIIGFSKSIALELGSRNIRCNVIAPGFIATEMTKKLDDKIINDWLKDIPLKRPGTPEDIANTCLYLGSELSSYVTGKVHTVDGGMLHI